MAPELVVHERVSKGKGANGTKEMKKVIGWSSEEMREKPNNSWEKYTEEMCEWRGLSQNEVHQGWKKLAEKMEEEVLDK